MVTPDVLDQPAAAPRTLETEPDVGPQEAATPHEHILHAARHLAPDHEPAMAMVDGAAFNDHVPAFPAVTAAVFVLPRLQADRIIAHVERRAGEADIFAGVDVDAVAVRGIMRVPNLDIPDRQIFAIERMQVPARGILEGAAFDEHPFALPQGDHHGTQERQDLLFVERGILAVERTGRQARFPVAFIRIPDAPVLAEDAAAPQDGLPQVGRDLAFLDFPPRIAVPIDHAGAGDGNVRCAERMDRRQAAADVQSLEIRLDNGIERPVGREDDDRFAFQVQVDVAFQADRAGQPDARRHDKPAAAPFGQGTDGRGECLRGRGDAVTDGTEIRQEDAALRDGGQADFRHVERQVTGFFLSCAARRKDKDGT